MILSSFIDWYYVAFYYLFFRFIREILDLFYPMECFGYINEVNQKNLIMYKSTDIEILLKNHFYRINYILKLVTFLLKCFFFKIDVKRKSNKKYNHFANSMKRFNTEIIFVQLSLKKLVDEVPYVKKKRTVLFFKYYKSSILSVSLLLLNERIRFNNDGVHLGSILIDISIEIFKRLNQ